MALQIPLLLAFAIFAIAYTKSYVTKLITYEHMCCAAERLLLLVAQLIHVAQLI